MWKRSTLAAVVSVAVVAAGLGPAPAFAAPVKFTPLKAQSEHVVGGTNARPLPFAPDPAAARALKTVPAAVWPTAGSSLVDTGSAAAARATGLPVRVSAAKGLAAAPGQVRVDLLNRTIAPAPLANAVLVRLTRTDAAVPTVSHVDFDYSPFRTAYGGDWAQRLHVEALPDCALLTPEASQCRGTALASHNANGTVSADVTVPSGSGTLLALTAGASGSSGSFGATTLSASGTWEAGGSSGDFSWSYPFRVPPSLGGPEPTLSLGYSAQSVDGRMAASNNQPSWIGEGFEFGTGYVERRYKGCADDMGGTANNTTATGDLCWATDNATMSLGGKVSELIKDDATGAWHPKTDDGSRIEHLTGATNGDDNGEYWKVTTAEGTQYWFGLNRLPGWVSGKPTTNSTWTEPVFGNNTGEPCHQSSFDGSWCNQAWRWSLDYVVDPHGNSMSYWYTTELNKYGRNLDPTKVSAYVRAGYLKEIDYGTRTEAEFGNPPARVLFTVADRCLPNTTCDAAHPANWPDVPWDQDCSGSTCLQAGPSFWTTKRLSTVVTQVWAGTAYRDVESWTLKHSYPDPGDGTRAGLWLNAIGHTGLVGGTATVPDITFTGVQLANRVDTIDLSPPMNWWRIASIRTDAGGEISVAYAAPDCVPGSRMPASPETNTLRCYPVKWRPAGSTSPVTDWFHKYVVTSVSETDHTGGSPRVLTAYTYYGTPAWHYTDDDGLVQPEDKTWSQWRGYERVGTTKGDPGEQSYGEIRYFRGMDGDHLPSGTRQANLTDSRGGTFVDSDVFAGQARERITFSSVGGTEASSILTDPWQSPPSATRVRNGVTTNARFVNSAVHYQRIALDGGRGFRETKSVSTFDQYGAATQEADYGDLADPNDDQCTTYTYARNTTAWLLTYTSRVQTSALPCGQTPTSPDQVIGDARTSFDGHAWGTPPSKGDTTRVEALKAWSNGTPTYVTTARAQYDTNGRITDAWDTDGNHTTTAYTPATGGPVTRMTVTNALGHVTITDREPAWGSTTGITDPNNRRSDVAYDPLGRTVSVWLPGRPKGVKSPNSTYGYALATDAPAAVTTQTLNPSGAYVTRYDLYDSLLRPRQTQVPAVGAAGGRIITDTLYDSAGRAYKQNAAYVAEGSPGTTLFLPAGDNQVAAQTLTLFDGADRPTTSILRAFGAEKWRTSTYYGGDHTDVTAPAGGIATASYSDARGRATVLREYRGPSPSGPYDTTTYTYNSKNLPATVVDTAGNTWRYSYDVQGRPTSISDPDKGTSTSTYDDAGHVLTNTDGRGHTLAYTYDALGRQTATYDGSTSGPKLTETVYDTIAKGQVTSSTRYMNGNPYTTSVSGYDPMYRPTGTRVSVPAAEGALAGTYQFSTTYKPDGSPSTLTVPATGGLAQETLGYSYGDLGQPTMLGGLNTYVTQADYTRLGEPAVLTLSIGGAIGQIGYYYDETTRRLNRLLGVRQTAPSTLADVNLSYDPAGNVTKIADTPTGGTADTQCFGYDGQRRLTEAWTPSSGDCTTTPTTTGLGGPAPYWQSFRYDTVGNRTSLVEHPAGGDVTTTYTYPVPGSPQPHTLRSTTTVDGSGSRTVSFGYDPGGNTVTRPNGSGTQTLTWDAEGRIGSIADTSSGGTSSYVYDANGNRLIRHDSTGSTLYLPGVELRATTGGQTSATRYYSFAGTTVAQRTSAGVTWLMADHQGSAGIAVAAAGSQSVTQRRHKPFGEPRGPSSWPNEHGFVNGTNEPDSLVHLGAREYDSASGRFISGDPVFDPSDPHQMLGYAYSANNPVTASDASGLMYMMDGGGGGGGGGSSAPPNPPPSPKPAPTKPAPPPHCEWWDVGCHAKQAVSAAVNWVDQNKAAIVGIAVGVAVGVGCGALIGWTGVGAVACGALAGAAGSAAQYLMETQVERKSEFSWGGLALNVGIGALTGAVGGALGSIGGAALKAGAGAIRQGIKAAGQAALKAAGREATDIASGRITGGLLQNAGKGALQCAANSFTPGTAVLLANGAAKSIETLQPGDLVLAGDSRTGKATEHRVEATITGVGSKDMVEIGIDAGTSAVHHTESVTATAGHPFWVVDRQAWVDAGKLQPGDQVLTVAGEPLAVLSVRHYTMYLRVFNLTVEGLHTYYVGAGSTSVLVHNCGVNYGPLDSLQRPTGVKATIDNSMIGTGTHASNSIRPPGWDLVTNGNRARGHLLGRQLGGSGGLPENLVTLTQNPTNTPLMRSFENQIRAAVEGGQIVDFSAIPLYSGDDLIPFAIELNAKGSGGFCIGLCIFNPAAAFN